ncbi:phage major capsid protein [Bradyrhizobium sp. S3.7.6]
MNVKQLRKQKRALEASAKAKLAEIVEGMDAEAARAIETEHQRILGEIAALDAKIVKAVKAEKRAAAATDDAEDDDAEEDEEDDDDEQEAPARNRAVLTRAQMAELVAIDTQARGLKIDLNLAEAVTRGEKPDAMRKRLFAELAKQSEAKGPTGGGSDVVILRDEREGVAQAMELALVQRVLGSRGNEGIEYKPKAPAEKAFVERYRKQSEQYMNLGIVDIAARCIGYRGTGTYLSARQVDDILSRAFHSTSDFPNIFTNVLNKSLLARYETATPTYRRIATQRNFNDFRPHPQIRAGDFPQLQPVNETGEIQYGTSQDNKETVSVSAYGVVFTVSRQMLVNDDLGAIDQILGSAGVEVQRFENTTFYAMFNSNPTLNQDSTAVFASGHGNLAASGGVPSITTIGAGRKALRGMKSLSGIFLNVPPKILLCGPTQETAADQMVTAIAPTLTTSVNPFSGRLEVVSDANITGTEWYILTEPSQVPNYVYGFLNGSNGPRTRTFEPFGVQGIKISLEHDFGCGAIDYRGAYKDPGV